MGEVILYLVFVLLSDDDIIHLIISFDTWEFFTAYNWQIYRKYHQPFLYWKTII